MRFDRLLTVNFFTVSSQPSTSSVSGSNRGRPRRDDELVKTVRSIVLNKYYADFETLKVLNDFDKVFHLA